MDSQAQLALAKQWCAYNWYQKLAEVLLPKGRINALKADFNAEGASQGNVFVSVPELNQFVVLCRARDNQELAQYFTTIAEEFSREVMDNEHEVGKCLQQFVDQALPITREGMAIIQDSLCKIDGNKFYTERTSTYLFLMELIADNSDVLEEAGIQELVEKDADKFSYFEKFIGEITQERML